jgi:hypothetical protein
MRRFATLMRDDDVLWKEVCRHRFDDSWLGRREWATPELVDPGKPWLSRYRQTIHTLRRWRKGECTHRSVDVREVADRHGGLHPHDILALDIAGDVLATGDVNGLVCIWSLAADTAAAADADAAAAADPVRYRYTLRGHTDNIVTIMLHCNRWNEHRGRVLTTSDDATARIWDMETRACLHVLEHPVGWWRGLLE